ncbi:MAG TPA: DUF547 domain-containing protein [Burkholderiales bacterium]
MDPSRELSQALAALTAFFDAEGRACDFRALSGSRERGRLAVCMGALAQFDPASERIAGQTAFWVNVFNACVLRDVPELEIALEGGKPDVALFFERPRVTIHGHAYSLDDIYHGVLRGGAPPPGGRAPMPRDDPRLMHVPIALDERLHFALFRGTVSSPAFRVFGSGSGLDAQLEQATERYLQRTVQVDADGRTISVPKLLQWYAADFGGKGGALEFVVQRLDDATFAHLEPHLGHLKLRFLPFDWRLNRR